MGVALLCCIAVVVIAIVISNHAQKRREEWRHDNWGKCYKCFKAGMVAGWRVLRGGTEDRLYIAVPACARCRQARELAAEQEKDRKIPFYDSRSAAEDLAEQMNDDVRKFGRRVTEY